MACNLLVTHVRNPRRRPQAQGTPAIPHPNSHDCSISMSGYPKTYHPQRGPCALVNCGHNKKLLVVLRHRPYRVDGGGGGGVWDIHYMNYPDHLILLTRHGVWRRGSHMEGASTPGGGMTSRGSVPQRRPPTTTDIDHEPSPASPVLSLSTPPMGLALARNLNQSATVEKRTERNPAEGHGAGTQAKPERARGQKQPDPPPRTSQE